MWPLYLFVIGLPAAGQANNWEAKFEARNSNFIRETGCPRRWQARVLEHSVFSGSGCRFLLSNTEREEVKK